MPDGTLNDPRRGTLQRVHDPREDRYRLLRTTPPGVLENAPRYDYVLSHRPFYSQDGADALATAFANNMPVVAGLRWPDAWMGANADGVMDGTVQPGPNDPGHAVMLFGVVRHDRYGWVVPYQQSWDTTWSHPRIGFGLRDGEAAIPLDACLRMAFEFRAVTLQPIVPQPDPTPQPAQSCRTAALAAVDAQAAIEAERLRGQPRSVIAKARVAAVGDVRARVAQMAEG